MMMKITMISTNVVMIIMAMMNGIVIVPSMTDAYMYWSTKEVFGVNID